MKQRNVILILVLGTFVANGVGFTLYKLTKKDASHAAALSGPTSSRPDSHSNSTVIDPTAADPNADIVRARRAAGLAAIESGDYDQAVEQFTAAAKLSDRGDIAELLRISTDMKARADSKNGVAGAAKPSEPAPVTVEKVTAPDSSGSHSAPVVQNVAPATPSRPSRPSERPVRNDKRNRNTERKAGKGGAVTDDDLAQLGDGPQVTHNGQLIVTSTPPGMVVQIDGKTIDLTPARVNVKSGQHRVVLVYNERRVLDESIDVPEDGVRAVNKELAPEPVTSVAASDEPPAPVRPIPQATQATGASGPASNPVTPAAARNPPTAAARPTRTTGDLVITSPGLYGEVWINDRPYGYPPVTANGLPAGKARIEIRVHGEVKRSATVDVVAAQQAQFRVH